MGDAFCTDCKKHTEVVFDHSAGDTVCSECGLVLESHSIDETSEWRTFANESNDNDPVRVGGPTNPLLSDGGLSTVISKPNGTTGDYLSSSLGRWQNRGANPDRGLILAFKTIATMADRLGLVSTIKDRASEIYKKVEDQKSSRGRNQDAILAACLYIACRQEDKPRTVKEICSVANGATKKEIGRAKEYIVKQLEVEMGQAVDMGTIHAGDFLEKSYIHCSCSNLYYYSTFRGKETPSRFVPPAMDFDTVSGSLHIQEFIWFLLAGQIYHLLLVLLKEPFEMLTRIFILTFPRLFRLGMPRRRT